MANRLINEQSPYLQQHAHNPVDWYPWGDEAFERARTEDRPLLVSIGYAACHWCHVMERESFENEGIAAYMNEHFICIKVDREEHPDVDHLYMDAVQAISGSGGWPLNVFVTPDRLPFYGGTYYPPSPAYNRPSWSQLLQRMNDIWTNERGEVKGQAEQMLQYLKQASSSVMSNTQDSWDMDTCRQIADTILKQADTVEGGFGNAPKFPGTMAISFLLEHYHYTGHEPSLEQALLSLDKMIGGGIYDQVGGGFSRYATDREWLIPHFEKMLYDNALLIRSLCDAYSITKDEKYKYIIEDTITFVDRELKHESGGYYCALDADSEGVEGKFYTWTYDECKALLGDSYEAVAMYWGISSEGNWEHTNILNVAMPLDVVAEQFKIEITKLKEQIEKAKKILFSERAKRPRPLTDDKCLLSWNALMNHALSKAGVVLGNDTYLQTASAHMEWMLGHFQEGDKLLHCWKDGKAKITAKLDDHAYLVEAMIDLASATGDNGLIAKAASLTDTIIQLFLHEQGSFFYFSSSEQADIPVRKVETYDGACPSANAVMANNLLWLGMGLERNDWLEHAGYMLNSMASTTVRYAYSFSYWAMLLQRYAKGLRTVVISGDETNGATKELGRRNIPHICLLTVKKEIFDLAILSDKKSKGELLIFVCTQQACMQPVSGIEEAVKLIYQ